MSEAILRYLLHHARRPYLTFDQPSVLTGRAARYTSIPHALDCVWSAATFASIAMEVRR